MAQQHISTGTAPAGTDGDTVRTAMGKCESNFTDLYGQVASNATTANTAQTTANTAQTAATDAQLKGGLRNLLINATGAINQRGYVSGSATTVANQYTVDRWKVKTSGQNVSWTMANGIATFTAPAGGMSQVVEGTSILGGNYTLSWTGTATGTVAGNAVTSGTPFTLPANTNTEVVFSGGTFSEPQLELGERTPFDFRPAGIELILCQRYAFSFTLSAGQGFATGVQYSASGALCAFNLPVMMRVTPTMTITGLGIGWAGDGVANTTNPSAQYPCSNIVDLLFNISGATQGIGGYAHGNSGGTTTIIFDAEL